MREKVRDGVVGRTATSKVSRPMSYHSVSRREWSTRHGERNWSCRVQMARVFYHSSTHKQILITLQVCIQYCWSWSLVCPLHLVFTAVLQLVWILIVVSLFHVKCYNQLFHLIPAYAVFLSQGPVHGPLLFMIYTVSQKTLGNLVKS